MASDKQLSGRGALDVYLVTPAGSVLHENTDAVIAPGELGEFEVFSGHVPFLTKIHAGVLTLGESGKKHTFAVGRGVLEVESHGIVRILVERAVTAKEVDVDAARAEIDTTEPALRDWKEPLGADYQNLKERHDWAKAQLDARRAA